MIPRCLFGALALLCALAPAIQAQEKSEPKAAASGMGVFQKDRPKNAKTEITAKGEATFNNETGVATFVNTVFVKDPQFNLYCDKLTVYLNKERKGIDRAEAEGRVVIVQENTNDKKDVVKSIGRSGKAVFTPATGEAVLTALPGQPQEGNWPQLQQGINTIYGTDPNTIIYLFRDGRMNVKGPNRSKYTESSD